MIQSVRQSGPLESAELTVATECQKSGGVPQQLLDRPKT